MAYLDISPMLQAMRARPFEFEMQGSYLRHRPSHHLVNFDIWGNARVHARCDCAMLEVSRDQSDELKAAVAAWKIVYWEPHLAELEAERRAARINREFAAHFRPPGLIRRLFARLAGLDRLPAINLGDGPAGAIVDGIATPPSAGKAERELLPS
jgi:hypothetical protein